MRFNLFTHSLASGSLIHFEEFYALVDLTSPDLKKQLQDWQDYYHQFRPHGSLGNHTPWERGIEHLHQTPYTDEVEAMYDPTKERIQHQNYRVDLALKK